VKQTLDIDYKKWDFEDPTHCYKLTELAAQFVEAIVQTADKFPWPLVKLLSKTSKLTKQYFSQPHYTALANLVFLRFFCAFIVCPDKILQIEISPKQRQTLVYVAKQSLVSEGDQNQHSRFIDSDHLILHYSPVIKKYLDDILTKKGMEYEINRTAEIVDRVRDIQQLVEFFKQVEKKQELELQEITFLMDSIINNTDYQSLLSIPVTKRKRRTTKPKRTDSHESFFSSNLTVTPKQELSCWSKKDVCQWLRCQGLEQYCTVFCSNSFNGNKLSYCTSSSLLDLGITNLSHRKRIVKEKELLKEREKAKSQNPVYLWSVDDICCWAKKFECSKTFRENIRSEGIRGEELCGLDAIRIMELGVLALKPRKRIIDSISQLKFAALLYLREKDISTWSSKDLAGLFVIKQHGSIAKQIKKVNITGKDISTLVPSKLQCYGFSLNERNTFFAEIRKWQNEASRSLSDGSAFHHNHPTSPHSL